MIIIGITGYAHSGKDTASNYLYQYYLSCGKRVCICALGDQLKVICCRLLKLFYNHDANLADFYDMVKKEEDRQDLPEFGGRPFKIRNLLQTIGTDICREMLYQSVWCEYIKQHYIDSNLYDVVIVSDIRMPDEIKYFSQIPNAIFKCFRIVRENRDKIDVHNQQHSTEQSQSQLDVTDNIDNNGTIAQLHDNIYKQIIMSIQ